MNNDKIVSWILRVGVAGEFFGHGVLAIGKKPDWIKWVVQLTHVEVSTATTFIVAVGIFDVIVAAIVLIKPIKSVLLWATFWGFWTALVRPLVSVNISDIFSLTSPWLDFIERFANWAAPLALYYILKKDEQSKII